VGGLKRSEERERDLRELVEKMKSEIEGKPELVEAATEALKIECKEQSTEVSRPEQKE